MSIFLISVNDANTINTVTTIFSKPQQTGKLSLFPYLLIQCTSNTILLLMYFGYRMESILMSIIFGTKLSFYFRFCTKYNGH